MYTIKLDGRDAISGQEGYGNVSKTPAGNSPECNTDGGCEHTYTVASASAEVPFNECSKTFKVKKKVTTEVTATCSVGGSLYQGQPITLDVSNITNIGGNVQMVWNLNGNSKTIDCGTGGCWNNGVNAPTTAGNYPYTLTYAGQTVCSGSVEIGSLLTCSVTPTTLNKGDDYTFTGANNVNCWSCSYTYDSGTEGNHNPTDAITKTASTTGTKTLMLSCSCNNNITGTCSKDITINQAPPSFTCETSKTATVSTSVALTPQNLSGCEDGCSYTIAGTSVTGSGYTSGALPGFTGPASAGTVSYTVSLTNSANTTSHDCSVTWTAVSSSSAAVSSSSSAGGCHCTDYCTKGCGSIITASGTYNSDTKRCLFFTSASKLNINSGSVINGKTLSTNPQCYNKSDCDNWLTNTLGASKVDGGYYMYIPNWVYSDVTISGSNPCSGGGGGASSSSAAPESSSSGSGGGDYVNVDLSGSVARDFNVGTSYKITKCGTDTKNLKCDANGGGKELYVNDSKVWTSFDWQNLTGNYQSAGDRCVVGNVITVKNGMIRCVNGW